jgi:hypothetical protein
MIDAGLAFLLRRVFVFPNRYPEGVKFLIAPFRSLFGTALGATIRSWCASYGWALVWVVENGATCLDPRRLLDPVVLNSTTLNVTLPGAFPTVLDALWQQANSTQATTWPAADYLTAWEGLVNGSVAGVDQALLWAFGVRDCEDYDNCIGVVDATGDCACYHPADVDEADVDMEKGQVQKEEEKEETAEPETEELAW